MMHEGLVFLHGFLGDARDFDGLPHTTPSIAIDLPGHGNSPAPPPDTSFDAGVDLVRRRIEEFGLRRCHVVGYSMGGRIALSMLRQDDDLIASVTAIGAHVGITDPEQRRQRLIADHAMAERIEEHGLDAFLDGWYRQDLFASLARHPEFEAILSRRRAGRADALAQALRTFSTGNQPPLHDTLAMATPPILLIAGASDAKYIRHNQDVAARCPGVESRTVPDSGHSVHLENPIQLVSILSDFLERDRS
jgi:2-succinyl-6-hydroxy-2,4-cyclohexadiene-1-carboxylate synthase